MTSEPPQPSGAWQLKALHTAEDAPPAEITAEGLSIGRAESNDIILPSADFPGVSSTHVRVVRRDGAVVVEDLGSKNGTYVSGQAITRVRVSHGDVIELGKGGPRFVVLGPADVDQTALVGTPVEPRRRSMGADTVEMVREKLGIPAHTKVTDVVTRENRRNTLLLVIVLVVLVGGGIYGIVALQQAGDDLAELRGRIDQQLREAAGRIDTHQKEWDASVERMEAEYRAVKKQNREDLERERDRLRAELQTRGSADDVAKLTKQLEETKTRLAALDPLTLAQTRIATVSRVGHAVVLIEVAQRFVERTTKRMLYVDQSGAGFVPNLDKKGELYVQESTGSGFCFSKEGWILTNAHVILKKDAQQKLRLGADVVLDSDVEVEVVFSDTELRHRAEVKDWVVSATDDLALIKIAPFPGMPTVAGIETGRQRPTLGTVVYVLGFPLGKRALQQGQTVIASAFRGIVSRKVDAFLQVDAAVHPGNSGGPVIDEGGNIVGVVVGMQRINAKEAAPDMGYIIPIDLAAKIWPYRPNRPR